MQAYVNFSDKNIFSEYKSVLIDFNSDSPTLLVAFGGISGGLMIPPFEFFNILKPYGIKKMFLRDFHQAWFLKGLVGIKGVDDVDTLAEYISDRIAESRCKKVVFVGNSAGGYAALLFGKLLNVDEVHAFVPQTFLDEENRKKFGETRWGEHVPNYLNYPKLNRMYLDLANVLRTKRKREKTEFNVYYDGKFDPDRLHCERLSGYKGVKFHVFDFGGHGLIKHLKENGQLVGIINSFVMPKYYIFKKFSRYIGL